MSSPVNSNDSTNFKQRRTSSQSQPKLAKDAHASSSEAPPTTSSTLPGNNHRTSHPKAESGPSSSSGKGSPKDTLPSASKSSKIPDSAYYNVETKTFWPRRPIRLVTPDYLDRANLPSKQLDMPRKHLVILDLNGTLFYRTRTARRAITIRPYLPEFLKFLFDNFRVMVWSSATPPSVEAMLQLGLGQYIDRLDRVWTRQDFGLDNIDYNRKVLTLKDLEIVWRRVGEERAQALKRLGATVNSMTSQNATILPEMYAVEYDQTNTILIDDSHDKSQLQKYNCIVLADFDQARARAGNDIELLKVKGYLRKLAYQDNVSAFMKASPFNSETEPIEYPDEREVKEASALSNSIDELSKAFENTTLENKNVTA